MCPRIFTRRALLASGAALGLTTVLGACSTPTAAPPAATPTPDPDATLLRELVAGKANIVTLYARAGAAKDPELQPFLQRHQAHLTELRRRLGGPSPTPSPSPTASAAKVTLSTLREAERRAAAGRPQQVTEATPSLSQLIASIGACEAAHVLALSRLL
ncbi:hypothetical protein [Sinosporangium siamense]|uniref:Ferritin-like domain-containing protein n=1 Tax=Sinosporangium siamense TaxID=1367973 RepID=A0A919V2E8_9ACTN|nr:hypothetical protein [Sinosporangium siamense]GII89835.1 hypothetical protein Ssi02_00660 [Sinosporangium siamense]